MEGYRIEEVATPQTFKRDPKLVWRFYNLRRANLRSVQPNSGHRALVAIEQRWGVDRFTLITQTGCCYGTGVSEPRGKGPRNGRGPDRAPGTGAGDHGAEGFRTVACSGGRTSSPDITPGRCPDSGGTNPENACRASDDSTCAGTKSANRDGSRAGSYPPTGGRRVEGSHRTHL